MESSNKQVVRDLENKQNVVDDQLAEVVEWEDYEQELVRLCSLTFAFEEAKSKKLMLEEKLRSLIQIREESLSQSNELEQMCEKLECRKLVMVNMSMHVKISKEKSRKQEEQLSSKIRSLLVGGTSLSVATKRMQDSGKSLAGERGCVHSKNLQKLLRERQQCMVSQVSFLYPVKSMLGKASEQELESFSNTFKSVVPKPIEQGMLTISGLQLTGIPVTKLNIFSDKKEIQRSSTALGYVAQAVSLIACYLQVPLRYPLRLGGSRSYVCDYAPWIEHSDLYPTNGSTISSKPVEFPLFIEGQESTRTAYAVFLLNKDLEQLLNFIGLKSLGPRHVLANLKELLMTILDPKYTDT